MKLKYGFIILLFSVVAMFVSCEPEEESIDTKYGKEIGTEGGKYEGINGVKIIVPEGALKEKTAFRIYKLSTSSFTNVSATVTNIYQFTPGGIKFEKPVTIVIPYSSKTVLDLVDSEYFVRAYFGVDRVFFSELDSDTYTVAMEEGVVKIETSYLGNFHVGVPKESLEAETDYINGVLDPVLIASGKFDYGAPAGTPTGADANASEEDKTSKGLISVDLAAYYMSRYEVTNSQYQLCVDAGVCTEPRDLSSYSHPDYFSNPAFQDYPVINVSWNQATTFCQWIGWRLPTEAEWEKAARGENYRDYPWGSDEPHDDGREELANFLALYGDVTAVDSYGTAPTYPTGGLSPYNIYNMAGNVSEWVSNWFDYSTYYGAIDTTGKGPSSGVYKVIKGGSWISFTDEITTYSRDSAVPHYSSYYLGFRCAKEAE